MVREGDGKFVVFQLNMRTIAKKPGSNDTPDVRNKREKIDNNG